MEPWSPVGTEAVAEVPLGLRCRFFGANSWSVLLLPRVTLGLALLRACLDFRLFPLFDMRGKLLVGLAPVLGARRPRPRRVHDQAFAEP